MEIRILKTALVAAVALLALLGAGQNLVNLDQAYGVIATVVSMEGHVVYPTSLGPAITSPALIWATVFIIILAEIVTGLLAARGAWDMLKARKAPAAAFNAAKKFAVLGCGMALVVWFGLFTVIGGAYFQMWQTEIGVLAMNDAFKFAGMSGLVLLFVNMQDA